MRPNRTRRRGRKRPGRAGFTLTELMIAIGLLGVGMTMAMSLFPAAIKENNKSLNSVLGTIICQNAAAICKARMDHPEGNNTKLEDWTERLGKPDMLYPVASDTNKTVFGFVVLGRRMSADRNDYQLAIISYRKQDAKNTIELKPFGANAQDYQGTVRIVLFGANANHVQVGGVVIRAGTGAYGRITGIEGANAILDRPAGFKGMSDKPVWLVVEKKPGGQIVTDLSAVMSVLVTRTALREKSST